jgi:hypothetical protein
MLGRSEFALRQGFAGAKRLDAPPRGAARADRASQNQELLIQLLIFHIFSVLEIFTCAAGAFWFIIYLISQN